MGSGWQSKPKGVTPKPSKWERRAEELAVQKFLGVKMKCQCNEWADDASNGPIPYEPEEYEAMKGHTPGNCPGTYKLAIWNRNGKELILCSTCCKAEDTFIGFVDKGVVN